MLENFQEMWDGLLGQISKIPKGVWLWSPEAIPIHAIPYCARPKEQQGEKEEIDEKLAMKVIISAQEEWASPIDLVPKKDETLGFV